MKNPIWTVKAVTPKSDYTLVITFENGEKRIYNALPLLSKPIFKQLNNKAFFMRAKAECGTIIWDEDIDIAPEHLYECSSPLS